ncbi:MAG: serine/threonine-protein kinase [Myxococcota bacterium]
MEQFGNYVLIRRLAQGGMSEVFEAQRMNAPPGSPPLVLKRLLPELEGRADVVDMFLTEADVTTMLRHPNIVQVYESGEFYGRYYMVMEMMDGPDLSDVQRASIEQGVGISMAVAIYVCIQALRGLDYVHQARSPSSGRPFGIIHRDISPENLFCSLAGQVKVADFGIAKLSALEGFTSLNVGVKGKLSFMAPEQIRGEPLDGRTDEFAVGLVLYELCTGRRAYYVAPGETEVDLMERVKDAKFVKPRKVEGEIPRRLQNAMLKALERKPGNRFKTCGEFADELVDVARKEALEANASHMHALLRELFPQRFQRPPTAAPVASRA